MAYNKIHFKLIDEWKPRQKLKKTLPPRATWCSPETLFIIAEFTLRKHYFTHLPKDLFWPAIFGQLRSNEIIAMCQYLTSTKRRSDVKFLNHWEKLTNLMYRNKNTSFDNKMLIGNLRRRKTLNIVPMIYGSDSAQNNVSGTKFEMCRIELNSLPLIL